MRFHVLACDYDGTLALHGRVDALTVEALQTVRASGRKLVLVTGRRLDELLSIFPEADLFEYIVAENGALLYQPETGDEKLLADAPPAALVNALRQRGVEPALGNVIVATWRPYETMLFQVIRDLNLDWSVILNKDAVMALPAGVNKATGLAAALSELGLSRHEAVGIGDAENDHVLFAHCEFAAAVANALPAVKEHADWVTPSDHGSGVRELIARLLDDDLRALAGVCQRHRLVLGHGPDGAPAWIPAYGASVLLVGPSEPLRINLALRFIECWKEKQLQYCVIDTESCYGAVKDLVTIGGKERGPTSEEVLNALQGSSHNVAVNLSALSAEERRALLASLCQRLIELRREANRPHWLLLDRADQTLSSFESTLEQFGRGVVASCAYPECLSEEARAHLDHYVFTGPNALQAASSVCQAEANGAIELRGKPLEPSEALLWRAHDAALTRVQLTPLAMEKEKHAVAPAH